MKVRAHLAAVLALAGTAACQEPPSYRLRWAIEGHARLDTAACAESGLFVVRARAYDASGSYVDERLHSCFSDALASSEGLVDGPSLPPGRYAIELRGVDRTGSPWNADDPSQGSVFEPEPDDASTLGCAPEAAQAACRPTELVCDCQHLEVFAAGGAASKPGALAVEEGSTIDLPELVLVPPPECIDGMDNDRDGLVDAADPSCNVDFGDGTEGVPVGVTELRLDLTLLGRNTAVECSALPLRRLRITYVPAGSSPEAEGQPVLEDACLLDRPYVALLRLPAGVATFAVTGYDGIGTAAQPAEPVTRTKTFEVEISPLGGTKTLAIDFGSDDFLDPIVGPIRAIPGYVSEVGPGAMVRTSCNPPPISFVDPMGPTRGQLRLDRLRLTVLNGHGSPLDTPVALDDGTVLDGTASVPCQTPLTTAPLAWGSYSLAVEALSAEGEVCYSNAAAPALMAPSGSPRGLYLPRTYGDDGLVPASCRDCEVDADCGLEDVLFCVDGVCQQGCTSDDTTHADDAQCVSDVLGDLGFVCEADVCRPG
jgi:hypothetical protein